jgi:hypothetical protein
MQIEQTQWMQGKGWKPPGAKCELHNQTMTITTFSEK